MSKFKVIEESRFLNKEGMNEVRGGGLCDGMVIGPLHNSMCTIPFNPYSQPPACPGHVEPCIAHGQPCPGEYLVHVCDPFEVKTPRACSVFDPTYNSCQHYCPLHGIMV